MTAFTIFLITIGVLLLGGLIFMFIYTYPISKKVYTTQLVRTEPEKWGRVCSAPENEEQLRMWETGIKWAEENRGLPAGDIDACVNGFLRAHDQQHDHE